MSLTDASGLSRTAGCTKAGRLRVGGIIRTVAAGGPGTASKASIPSRFETILNTGPRERDGFGNRTSRFGDTDNELPGPGSYRKPRSLVNKNPGVSKKGMGSFASKTRIRDEELPPVVNIPGPGGYDLAKNPHALTSVHKHESVTFCNRQTKPVKSNRINVPGPGAYGSAPGMKAHDPDRISAVFREKEVQSLLYDPPKPGPGDYDALTAGALTAPSSSGASCAFKSTTTRSNATARGEDRLPAPSVLAPAAFLNQDDIHPSEFGAVLKHLKPEELKQPTGGRVSHTRPQVTKPSSSFVCNLLDRFGNPTVRYVAEDDGNPGPGAYELIPERPQMLISSSWALSGSPRFREGAAAGGAAKWKVPGPAYYNPPNLTTKVDHHVRQKPGVPPTRNTM
eukprot:PhM_4_TR16156/c0_g1_i2/m.77115